MSTYLLINILIVLVPLLLSFENKLKFYKNISKVGISIFVVGIIFIIWDILAVRRGDWSFNPEYVYNFNILGLPIEEILFFAVVPYSILFVYETLHCYIEDRSYNISKTIILYVSILFILLALLSYGRQYTFTVFIMTASVLMISYFYMPSFILSKLFILTILISLVPFFIVNYILTALPVVEYNPQAILGIKIFTIPLEDIFYSFTMISGWLMVYKWSEKSETKLVLIND